LFRTFAPVGDVRVRLEDGELSASGGDFDLGQIGVFYFDSSRFEGLGIRAVAGAVWRPFEHVGFFAGLKAIYVDLELKKEVIDDLTLWGPAVGLEFRF
jgi:hypothetical protein